MKLLKIVIGVFFIGLFSVQAQRNYSRVLPYQFSRIEINATLMFELEIEALPVQEISIEADFMGEYSDYMILQTRAQGQALFINVGINPMIQLPNDKLSAHKGFSSKIRIVVPEKASLTLFGEQIELQLKGNFKQLRADIYSGVCVLKEVTGIVAISTFSAPIQAMLLNGTVTAKSRYGKVVSDLLPLGSSTFSLQSVNGDIEVIKTQ